MRHKDLDIGFAKEFIESSVDGGKLEPEWILDLQKNLLKAVWVAAGSRGEKNGRIMFRYRPIWDGLWNQ